MHTIVNESGYGPNGRREALWTGEFGITSRDGTLEWIHRIRMDFCHITYAVGEVAESANGAWDTVTISSRIPMHTHLLRFERNDEGRQNFFMTLDLLEDAYENGKRAKLDEVHNVLGIKESR